MAKQETAYGYDGNGYSVGDRVEIHPGTDLWMQGARYGVVVGMSITPDDRVRVKLDKLPKRTFSGSADTFRVIDNDNSSMWTEAHGGGEHEHNFELTGPFTHTHEEVQHLKGNTSSYR